MTITTTREKISFRCVFSCFFVYIHTSVSAYEVRDAMCLRSLFAFGNWIICTFSFCLFCLFFKTFLSFFFLRSGTTSATDRPVAGREKQQRKKRTQKSQRKRVCAPIHRRPKIFFFKQHRERKEHKRGSKCCRVERVAFTIIILSFSQNSAQEQEHARTHQRKRKGNSLVRIHSNALNEAIGCGTFETRTRTYTHTQYLQ